MLARAFRCLPVQQRYTRACAAVALLACACRLTLCNSTQIWLSVVGLAAMATMEPIGIEVPPLSMANSPSLRRDFLAALRRYLDESAW